MLYFWWKIEFTVAYKSNSVHKSPLGGVWRCVQFSTHSFWTDKIYADCEAGSGSLLPKMLQTCLLRGAAEVNVIWIF